MGAKPETALHGNPRKPERALAFKPSLPDVWLPETTHGPRTLPSGVPPGPPTS